MRQFLSTVSNNLIGIAVVLLSASVLLVLFGIYTSKNDKLTAVLDQELKRKAVITAEAFLSTMELPLEQNKTQNQIEGLFDKVHEIEIVFVAIPEGDKFRIIASSQPDKIGILTSTPILESAWEDQEIHSILELRKQGTGNQPQSIKKGISQETSRIFEGAFPITRGGEREGLLFLRFSFADIDAPIAGIQDREKLQLILTLILVLPFLAILGFWANKKTKESNKLSTATKQKDALLSFAAHELNAPLGYIKSVLSLLSKEPISSHGRELMDRANVSIQQLINLVEDLLMVSRLEAGRLDIYPRPIHIEEVIQSVIPQFTKRAQDKGLTFTYTPSSAPMPKIVADPDKIREVITNFVSNAIKYTEKGGVTVKLVASGGFVKISVQDTGVGISEEERKKLFTQFGRLDKTKQIKGTGLGLYITNLLVKAHHGRIIVDSIEGKGSTFTVAIPIPKRLPKETKSNGQATTSSQSANH